MSNFKFNSYYFDSSKLKEWSESETVLVLLTVLLLLTHCVVLLLALSLWDACFTLLVYTYSV